MLVRQVSADQLHGDAVLLQNSIVKRAIGHTSRADQFFVKRIKLQCAQQLRTLIERTVRTAEGAPDFSGCVVGLVADVFDEEFDALLRRHQTEMKT